MPTQIQTRQADFEGRTIELAQYNNKHWISAKALGKALDLDNSERSVRRMLGRHMAEIEDEITLPETEVLLSLYAAQLVTLWFDSASTVSLRTWLKQQERALQLPIDLLPPADPKLLLDEIEQLNSLTECLNDCEGYITPVRNYIAKQNNKITEKLRMVLLIRERINTKCKEMIA